MLGSCHGLQDFDQKITKPCGFKSLHIFLQKFTLGTTNKNTREDKIMEREMNIHAKVTPMTLGSDSSPKEKVNQTILFAVFTWVPVIVAFAVTQLA
jgi:hypothetical protein